MKILNNVIQGVAILLLSFSISTYAQTPQIIIHGVNKEMEENIRANLSLLNEPQEAEEENARPEQMKQRATQEILTALQPYGYYDAEIQSTLEFENDTLKATFQINLGPPIQVQDLQINIMGDGENDPALQGLNSLFLLKVGDVFVHETYEEGKKAILSKTIQSGYLNATFIEHKVMVDIENHSSTIFLTLFTGERHYFGEVTFENTVLSKRLLDRYLPFEPGAVYSPEKTMLLQTRLSQSDYFASTNVKALTTEGETIVPIVVELEDAKPNQYLLGAGFGTDTGIRGKLGWTRRRLNAMGHRFSVQAQLSEIYDKIYVDYSIPGKRPYTDQIKLQGGFFDDEFSEKPSQIYEAGIIEERVISSWQRRILLNYHHERFNAFITNDIIESKLILPMITFIQIRKSESNPDNGRRVEFTVKGSSDALFSDTSFFQVYLQLKWVHAFSDSTRMLIRGDFGVTTPDNIENLPLSQRFFAGGDLSLRGYGYRSLPNEIDNEGNFHPVGGAYLAVGSLELVQTIKKPFGIFGFVDAGNAYRELFVETAIGVGGGLEWQTKLGPIKIALAKPLTKTADSWRIHATFGPELS
ncbi:MAG: BamA/TamA family outer membrane protein [Proteobacteria bacterium]|nr:BamA/TamA family outer membrane protein [Pseudomonadota bacterium]